ncbi:hypothetical protein RND81_02G003900 [Saponaria officinalis]|uniref:RING-CH-type domain-containing protein n=1 Tax=Saponaria officinalis TaxID=3572 RepID=A0AAW1MS97_SAPOF
MGEVVLLMNNLNKNSSSCAYNYCKICHEADYESSRKLEAPCACTGTIKFAHRECIQRWCDEKGDITCEICLKKYEQGYTAIPKQPKKILIFDEVVDFRGSMEMQREEVESEDILEIIACSSAIHKALSYCKTFALIVTAFLLLRHVIEVFTQENRYPFSLVTVIILKSCGVVIPMYMIIRTISAFQNKIKRHGNIQGAIIRGNSYN